MRTYHNKFEKITLEQFKIYKIDKNIRKSIDRNKPEHNVDE